MIIEIGFFNLPKELKRNQDIIILEMYWCKEEYIIQSEDYSF